MVDRVAVRDHDRREAARRDDGRRAELRADPLDDGVDLAGGAEDQAGLDASTVLLPITLARGASARRA